MSASRFLEKVSKLGENPAVNQLPPPAPVIPPSWQQQGRLFEGMPWRAAQSRGAKEPPQEPSSPLASLDRETVHELATQVAPEVVRIQSTAPLTGLVLGGLIAGPVSNQLISRWGESLAERRQGQLADKLDAAGRPRLLRGAGRFMRKYPSVIPTVTRVSMGIPAGLLGTYVIGRQLGNWIDAKTRDTGSSP